MKKTFSKLMVDEVDEKWLGVLSGIAKYTGIETAIVRALFILLAIIPETSAIILIYFLSSWFVMSEYDSDYDLDVVKDK